MALALAALMAPPARAQAQAPAEPAPAQAAPAQPAAAPGAPGFAATLPDSDSAGLPDVGSVTSAPPPPAAAPSGGDAAAAAGAAGAASPAPSVVPPADLGESIGKPAGEKGIAAAPAGAGVTAPAAAPPAAAADRAAPAADAAAAGAVTQAAATPPVPPGAAKAGRHAARQPRAAGAAKAAAGSGANATGSKDAAADKSNPFSAMQLSSGHGPIDIKSDTLELDYKGNTVTFRGHVRAVQADALLTSDSLRVLYGKDFHEVKEMFADGNVRMSQGTRWATGDHAVLDQAAHTVVLTGNPVVHDGEDQVAGTRITVHIDSGKSEVEGARAVLFPKQQQTRDNKGAPAAQQM